MGKQRKAPPTTAQQRLDRRNKTMRAMRRNGMPVADIARKYGLNEGYVRRITAGAVPVDRRNLLRRQPELYKQVAQARAEGFPIKAIAAHFKLPPSTASAIIRRHQAATKVPARQTIDEILAQLSRDLRRI